MTWKKIRENHLAKIVQIVKSDVTVNVKNTLSLTKAGKNSLKTGIVKMSYTHTKGN